MYHIEGDTMDDITAEDEIEVVSATRDGEAIELETGRWSQGDKDRLYINGGIPKADTYSLHVDLVELTVGTNNDAAHEGSVEAADGEITATIVSAVGGSESTYEIEIAVDRYEAPEAEAVDLEEIEEGDVVAAEWEHPDIPSTYTTDAAEVVRIRQGSKYAPTRYSLEGHEDAITEDNLVSIERVEEGE